MTTSERMRDQDHTSWTMKQMLSKLKQVWHAYKEKLSQPRTANIKKLWLKKKCLFLKDPEFFCGFHEAKRSVSHRFNVCALIVIALYFR